jgi:hypothetical protein
MAASLAVLLPEVVAVGSGFAAAGAGAAAVAALADPAIKEVEQARTDTPKQLAKLKLSPDEAGAVTGIRQLQAEFNKLSTAFQPAAFKVFNDGLKVANQLLPALAPFASAFAGALSGLTQQLGKFTASAGFTAWLKQFQSLVAPATTAIGDGIGKVANAFGKLLTTFSGADVARGINIAFSAISGAISAIRVAIEGLKTAWDGISQNPAIKRLAAEFQQAWDQISATGKKKPDFSGLVNAIKDAVSAGIAFLNSQLTPLINNALHAASSWLTANAGGILRPAGAAIMEGLIQGIESQLPSLLTVLGRVAAFIAEHKGPLDKDRQLLIPHGQAIMGGLMTGIGSQIPALHAQMRDVTSAVAGIGGGGGYGGGDIHLTVHGFVGSEDQLALKIQQSLQQLKRRGGGTALGLA